MGHILPPAPIFPWAPHLTREELERRKTEGGGQPLSETIKRMTVC